MACCSDIFDGVEVTDPTASILPEDACYIIMHAIEDGGRRYFEHSRESLRCTIHLPYFLPVPLDFSLEKSRPIDTNRNLEEVLA